MPVPAHRVDRVEEGDVLGDGDLEPADPVAVADAADFLARRLDPFGFGAGAVDRVGEGNDPDRRIPRRTDLGELEAENSGPRRRAASAGTASAATAQDRQRREDAITQGSGHR